MDKSFGGDSGAAGSAAYADRMYLEWANAPLLAMIDPSAKRILDVGCGTGANARVLRNCGHDVVAVTMSRREFETLSEEGFQCFLADCKENLPFPSCHFDVILMSHVLEHIDWPEMAIRNLVRYLKPGGFILAAVPNVMFFRWRWRLIRGSFPRESVGIFDETHLRWFTWHTPRELAIASGCKISEQAGDPWFRDIWWLPKWVGRLMVRLRPNLFSQQIRFKLTPIP